MTTESQFAAIVAELNEDRWWELLSSFVIADAGGARLVAESALNSDDTRTRETAVDVLGQVATVTREASGEIADALLPRLATEQDPDVLESLIVALGHTEDPRVRPEVVRHAGHGDENVRYAVAFALAIPDAHDLASLEVLRRLSADANEDVRNWATFGLAQSDAIEPLTVEALAARADDDHDETREEAILGLARRKDARARALIEQELGRPGHGPLVEEASEELDAG